MVQYIDKSALVAEIERRIEHNIEWKDACKTLAVLAANQSIEEDKKILSIINSLEVKEVQKEHCTETEFREIEILRTKLCDIAKAIYYHKGKENPTVEHIREIVQDCCFEIIDLKEPKQEESVGDDLVEAAKYCIPDESYHMTIESKEEGSGENVYDYVQMLDMFKAGAKWQKEQIEEVLLSEVLPCFMHGGEADEVVAKLDEVLNQKK